jgi:RimJ/RimL family protein N-acetyltransferase
MESPVRIVTERLILRPLRLEDAGAWFGYRSDPVANHYQGWIPGQIQDVIDFIRSRISPEFDRPGTWFQMSVLIRENKKMIGDIGIHFLDFDRSQVELGYTLDKNYQGYGYASEALSAVIDYLFVSLDKHRIIASVDPRNLKSIRLVERLGFRKEAHFHENMLINNEWTDTLVFAVLNEEWVNNTV